MNDHSYNWYQQQAQAQNVWPFYLAAHMTQAPEEQTRQFALAAAQSYQSPALAQEVSMMNDQSEIWPQVSSISPVPPTRSWAILGSPLGILVKLLQLGLILGGAAVGLYLMAHACDWLSRLSSVALDTRAGEGRVED